MEGREVRESLGGGSSLFSGFFGSFLFWACRPAFPRVFSCGARTRGVGQLFGLELCFGVDAG